MTELYTARLDSPLGTLTVTAAVGGVVAVSFGTATAPSPVQPACLTEAVRELEEYFAGTRTVFTVPVLAQGTPFQKSVWTALRDIPFGDTASYGAVAARIGKPRAMRAVGAANGRNRINIIVPCHRVVGADGGLTGYGGGLARKEWLLAHEARVFAGMRKKVQIL